MSSDKKFFLGVGGQQTGPHTEAEIKAKIVNGSVKPDALIWYEGLGEWQRIDTIVFFQGDFKPTKELLNVTAVQKRTNTPRLNPEALKPIFSSKEAVFSRPVGPRREVVVGAIVVLALGIGAFLYLSGDDAQSLIVDGGISKAAVTPRLVRFQKLEGEYLRDPSKVPPGLLELIKEEPKDEASNRAIALLESIYRKKKMLAELSAMYLSIGRAGDAVAPLIEAKMLPEAEKAAYDAYKIEADADKKHALLLRSIEIGVKLDSKAPSIIEKIHLLDKEYPSKPHPFGYYLLSPEKKMADLFNRVSFYFVESLATHLKAEFPQLSLSARPEAALVKSGDGHFRIVGKYKGEVVLSYDRLKNIRFEYWLGANEWALVETNVTPERAAWAVKNKSRQVIAQTSTQMLAYLENVMKNQFPQQGLHDKISESAMSQAARETTSAPQ
jgi:hypothetical protein